jgi:iron complex outermembrane receptor protein
VPSGAYFTPDGVSNSQTAATALGASHPDNPYFGTAARLSYLPLYDTGISGTDSSASTMRFVSGFRGTWAGWDYDTAINYSSASQTDSSLKVMDWRVKNALLNPRPQTWPLPRPGAPSTRRCRPAPTGASARTLR